MTEPTRLVVLLTGDAPDPIRAAHGDFTSWFRHYLGSAGDVVVDAVDVTGRQEHDPSLDLAGYDGVLMSGSAAMVAEDTEWMRFAVRTVPPLLARAQPVLGVCFGPQIQGLAVGADVGPNPRGREMGTVRVARQIDDDPLFSRLPSSIEANVSHADVIRDDRQGALQVVAAAPHDPFHAVRAGPWAWGVQYHPEFSDEVTRAYLEHRRATLDGERGSGTTDARLAALKATPDSHATLAAFVDVARARRRR